MESQLSPLAWLSRTSSRVSIQQIIQVALGSMTSSWGHYFHDPVAASKFIIALNEFLKAESPSATPRQTLSQPETEDEDQNQDQGQDHNQFHNHEEAEHQGDSGISLPEIRSSSRNNGVPSLPWLNFLSQHADMFVSSCNEEQQERKNLFALGRRRCVSFLAQRNLGPPPLFGLTDPIILLASIVSTEERISFLRGLARSFTNQPS